MNKLQKLIDLCKGEVVVTLNGHRSSYEAIPDYLYSPDVGGVRANEETLAEMVKRNQCVEVQFYPLTPVGSIYVAHWDLDAALDEALAYSGFESVKSEARRPTTEDHALHLPA